MPTDLGDTNNFLFCDLFISLSLHAFPSPFSVSVFRIVLQFIILSHFREKKCITQYNNTRGGNRLINIILLSLKLSEKICTTKESIATKHSN